MNMHALRPTERGCAVVALALIAFHIADDSFFQPQPGTAAGDHLVSGLVPIAVLLTVAALYGRLRPGVRGALALTLGLLGIVTGVEAVYYTTTVGPSGDDYSGFGCGLKPVAFDWGPAVSRRTPPIPGDTPPSSAVRR